MSAVLDIDSASHSRSYDQRPYPGHAYRETHPDHMATIGKLHGMHPPDVQHCRVMEIGCGDGNNLIPMAVSLPHSNFVGIDLSSVAIEKGKGIAAQIGLKNLQLECRDILEDLSGYGEFDYIIAHGFYSWVSQQVQQRLLSFCDDYLSPNGIVFVSFNTYPGCHLRNTVRELMLFGTDRQGDEKKDRAQRARGFLDTITRCAQPKTVWKSFLESESARISKRADSFLIHDELNAHAYSPVYFSVFVAAANLNHLNFLSEAKLSDMLAPALNAEVVRELRDLAGSDVIAFQQYLDFALFQTFRRTLLCRETVGVDRQEPRRYLPDLFVASPLRLGERCGERALRFTNRRAAGQIETNDRVIISALKLLERAWPKAEQFSVLLHHVCQVSPKVAKQDARIALIEGLLVLSIQGLVDLRTFSGAAASAAKVRPEASPLSRLQAQTDSTITTLLHTNVEIKDPLTRKMLTMLDGSAGKRELAKQFSPDGHSDLSKMESQISQMLSGFRELGLFFD